VAKEWKQGSLSGTQDGTNTSFTIPDTPEAVATLTIWMNGAFAKVISSGTPAIGECLVSGTAVTMGLAPNSSDRLRYRCRIET